MHRWSLFWSTLSGALEGQEVELEEVVRAEGPAAPRVVSRAAAAAIAPRARMQYMDHEDYTRGS